MPNKYFGNKMAKTDIINEDSKNEEARREQIYSQIRALRNELSKLEEKKKKIEEAMQKVEQLSSSSSLSNAGNSFNWIVNNMDIYWNATDSRSREVVKDTLTKVSKECGSSGKLLSQVGPIMAKANEKLAELNEKIQNINSEIARLESSLNVSLI